MSTDILTRNNVKVFGKGTRPMLFAHGFGCDQNMWRFVAAAFENDYKIVLFDFVGSGKSDPSAFNVDRYSNLNGYVEDLLEVIHALNLEDTILVAHSVSGMIGLLAANREPELFRKLIMIGPSPRYINDGAYTGGFETQDIEELLDTMDRNYIGWANFLGPVIMGNADRPELAGELTASFCSTDPVKARHFAKATFYADNRADLPGMQVPSLILQCTDDMIAPLEVGHYVHANMPGSSLRILAATGHCPHLSAPDETIAEMKRYLHTSASSAR
jgi:sigma-B regulation protein RsbQ